MDSSGLIENSQNRTNPPTYAGQDLSLRRSGSSGPNNNTRLGRTSPLANTQQQLEVESSQYMRPSYGQDQSTAVNEGTPIVRSGSESQKRHYQSTERLRSRVSASADNQSRYQGQSDTGDDHHGQNGGPGSAEEHHTSWYGRLADRYGSLELDNKGSVARDHLALERTFLAWLRTSLAFASIGIAVTQLFRLNSSDVTAGPSSQAVYSQSFPPLLSFYDSQAVHPAQSPSSSSERLRSIGKPLGTTFIGVAIIILIVGFHRYFEAQYWIVRGKFPASRGSVALISFIATALIVTAFIVILVVSPGAVEK